MSFDNIERIKKFVGSIKLEGIDFNLDSINAINNIYYKDGVLYLYLSFQFVWSNLSSLKDKIIRFDSDIKSVEVFVEYDIKAREINNKQPYIDNIKNIIAISSGKGGVGKSTVAVNIAYSLAKKGLKVGILDADIYGPSIPHMLGVKDKSPEIVDDNRMKPVKVKGVYTNSIGYVVGTLDPTIWRGPMASSVLGQLLNETIWPELDYLFIDMPPGTGDIQLTVSQKIPINGSVVVTTPQEIALFDVHKGINMFKTVNVPILGLVENMQVHICSNCGHIEHIFGSDGGLDLATVYGIDYLGKIPLDRKIRYDLDHGIVSALENSDIANLFLEIAEKITYNLYINTSIRTEKIKITQL